MKKITSEQNPILRQAIRLHESRGRRQQQRIIVFGSNEICMARESGVKFDEVFVSEEKTDSLDALIHDFNSDGVAINCLTSGLFKKLAFGDRNDGVVATASRPDTSLSRFDLESNALVVVLESIEKPGNIGAVFRSADAAGVSAVILADVRCDGFHPNAIRSSLGTVFSIPWAVGSSHEVRDFLIDKHCGIASAKVDATKCYFDFDMTGKTAIVLGSEHDGLSDAWDGRQINDIAIPMVGRVDSLNVSVSASVLLFEARRQRSIKNGAD